MLLKQLISAMLEVLFQQLLLMIKDQPMSATYKFLDGKVLRIKLAELDTPIILIFSEQQIDVLNAWNDVVDCMINVHLKTLLFLDNSQLFIKQGDREILQQLIKLLNIMKWDPTELLAPWLGDIVSEVIIRYFRHQISDIKQELHIFQEQITLAITDEWHITPSSAEFVYFGQEVDDVTLATEQLAACLNKLEEV